MSGSSSGQPTSRRFEVLRKLGEGGSGEVYLAIDHAEDDREVALKLFGGSPQTSTVLEEFRALRESRHPSIARAHSFGRLEDGALFLSLEHVPGPTLDQVSAELRSAGPQGRRRLLELFLRAAEALEHIHGMGLVHQDVKPQNLVVGATGLKLIDFGLVHRFGGAEAGPIEGTLLTLAPEVLSGSPPDPRSDLYSLGATFHLAFTGRFPFEGTSFEALSQDIRLTPAQAPSGLNEPLRSILLRLLAKAPEHRFQSAGDLAEELRSLERPPPAPLPPLEARLVGRERELESFFAWWDSVGRRTGPSWLRVRGGAGVGKTRLLDAAASELLGLGNLVLEHGAREPAGFSRLVKKALALEPGEPELTPQRRFLLCFAGLDSNEESERAMSLLDAQTIETRAFREARDLLARALRGRGALIIDDLDLAETRLRSFVETLGPWLAARPQGEGLALITSETGSAPATTPGAAALAIEPLRGADAGRLARLLAPDLPSPTVRRSVAQSEGNPGLLTAHLAAARQALSPTDAASTDAPAAAPPEASSPYSRNESLTLAVLGAMVRPAPADLLARVSGLSQAALDQALATLRVRGAIRGDQRGIYVETSHARLHSPPELSPADRAGIHGRIATELLRRGEPLEEIAEHQLRSLDPSAGVETALSAAAALGRRGRIPEAIRILTLARNSAEPGNHRIRLLEELARLDEKAGLFAEAAEALTSAISALEEGPGGTRARLLRRLGGVEQRRGRSEAARLALEEALRLTDEVDLDEHLHLLRELSTFEVFRGELERASSFAHRGLELLRSSGKKELPEEAAAQHGIDLHLALGHVHLRRFEYERAALELEEGLALARESGATASEALLLNHLGIARSQANQLEEALRAYLRASELAVELGDTTAEFSVLCNIATIHARLGRLGKAESILNALSARPHGEESRRGSLFLLHTKGLVARLALRDARTTWQEAIRAAEEISDPIFAAYGRLLLLENEIQSGRWKEARELLVLLRAAAGAEARFDRAVAARQAYLEALCGKRAEALAALDQAKPPSQGTPYKDLWDAIYAAAARLELGDLVQAEQTLGALLREFESSSQLPSALECRLLLADAALRRRAHEPAREEIAAAETLATRHDAEPASRNVRARLERLRTRLELAQGHVRSQRTAARLTWAAEESQLPDAEDTWIGWLVAVKAGGGSQPRSRLLAERRKFLGRLAEGDRAAYLARDMATRLGLEQGKAPAPGAGAGVGGPEAPRLEQEHAALLTCASSAPLAEVLLAAARALGSPRGALVVRDPSLRVLACHGFPPQVARRILQGAQTAAVEKHLQGLERHPVRLSGLGRDGELLLEAAPQESLSPSARQDRDAFLSALTRLLAARLLGEKDPRALRESTDKMRTTLQNTRARSDLRLEEVQSPRMRSLLELIYRTRDSELPVLLLGESGSGKDYLARWIHSISPRGRGPFVAQDCAAVPEGLLEADIFGYEAGAFTGAETSRTGHIFTAEGGTYYLDRVDGLTLEVQAKLLRVLEDQGVRPLGSSTPRKSNVRIIASSTTDLRELVARNEFRKDLYYRLAGLSIVVPPLRERMEDIPSLVERFRRQLPGNDVKLTDRALERLKAHTWPGNLRELEALIRRLAITAEGPVDEDRVSAILGGESEGPAYPRWLFEGKSFEQAVDDVKREYLLDLLDRVGGDIDAAARELKTSRRNLYFRLAHVGIRRKKP